MYTMIMPNIAKSKKIIEKIIIIKKDLSPKEREELIRILKARFEKNMNRHKDLEWVNVKARLDDISEKLWSLNEMERTGGEPDVIGYDKKTNEYIFNDCSAESPNGRRNVCYDGEGQEMREKKGVHPAGNAIDSSSNGYCAFNGRAISRVAETWKFRSENIELGENSS